MKPLEQQRRIDNMDKKENKKRKNQLRVARFIWNMIINVLKYGNTKDALATLLFAYEGKNPRRVRNLAMCDWYALDPCLGIIQKICLIRDNFRSNHQIFASCGNSFYYGVVAWTLVLACSISSLFLAGGFSSVFECLSNAQFPNPVKTTQVILATSWGAGTVLWGSVFYISAVYSEFNKRGLLIKLAIDGQSPADYQSLVDFCRVMKVLCPDIGTHGVKYIKIDRFYTNRLQEKAEKLILEQVRWILKAELFEQNGLDEDLPRARRTALKLVNSFYSVDLVETQDMTSWYDRAKSALLREFSCESIDELRKFFRARYEIDGPPADPFPYTWPELA